MLRSDDRALQASILICMADLRTSIPEVALRRDPAPRWWAPWLVLVLALTVPASYAVSMVLPYYVNDLDRFPLDEMPWGVDYTELWPYDTAYALPVGLAGIYALAAGPLVAIGTVLWVGYWWNARWRTTTWSARVATSMAVAVSAGTLAWLFTSPLASTLASWFLD